MIGTPSGQRIALSIAAEGLFLFAHVRFGALANEVSEPCSHSPDRSSCLSRFIGGVFVNAERFIAFLDVLSR